jgi:hypothetical protein
LTAIGVAVEMPSVLAVGRSGGDGGGPEHQAGAGLVLDHHRLAERLSERLGIEPCQRVHAGAGGERDDDRDRCGGIALGQGRRARLHDHERKQSQDATSR